MGVVKFIVCKFKRSSRYNLLDLENNLNNLLKCIMAGVQLLLNYISSPFRIVFVYRYNAMPIIIGFKFNT